MGLGHKERFPTQVGFKGFRVWSTRLRYYGFFEKAGLEKLGGDRE